MTKKKRSADPNERAFQIVREATEEPAPDADAKELGRRGGLKGGPARKKKLSKARRIEIAKKAAAARWAKKKDDEPA